MDALQNIVTNVPAWIKRLDELSGQTEQRQIELAKFAESQPLTATVDSESAPQTPLRNKGSTESLRPRDEPEAHPTPEDAATPATLPPVSEPAQDVQPSAPTQTLNPEPASTLTATATTATPTAAVAAASLQPPSPLVSNNVVSNQSPVVTQRQTNQVIAAAQVKARATLRKRNRSDSLISAEAAAPKYRSRTMVLVYYDKYVESFFEELVKFVSASRNLMRKAKMAAKVAQIKRMAELEAPEDGEDELRPDPTAISKRKSGAGDDDDDAEIPALNYVSTRNLRLNGGGGVGMIRPTYTRAAARGAYGGSGGFHMRGMEPQQPDGFDALDKGLEYVQSMCEHAAHQFLRDGDCNEEINNIKNRLSETNNLAKKEMERILKEDPDAAKPEPQKSRSYRVQSMRRDIISAKDSSSPATIGKPLTAAPALAPASTTALNGNANSYVNNDGKLEVDTKLEVDEGISDVDFEIPRLMYRSTRMMRHV